MGRGVAAPPAIEGGGWMFGTAMQVIMLLLVLAILVDNVGAARRARRGQEDIVRLLSSLVTARMRKGDFRCYCGGELTVGDHDKTVDSRQDILECEHCKALIILPLKEGERATG
jgi:hypothetical protein